MSNAPKSPEFPELPADLQKQLNECARQLGLMMSKQFAAQIEASGIREELKELSAALVRRTDAIVPQRLALRGAIDSYEVLCTRPKQENTRPG